MCIVILAGNESMPETSLPNVYCYEDILAEQSDSFALPNLEQDYAPEIRQFLGEYRTRKSANLHHVL